MQIDPEFRTLLSGWSLTSLDASEGSVYGLWADCRLGMTSTGWTRFAQHNDGASVLSTYTPGTSILTAIPQPLRAFYEAGWRQCRAGLTWEHTYECSSPDTFRRFRMFLHPLHGGAGMLVINALVESCPIADGHQPAVGTDVHRDRVASPLPGCHGPGPNSGQRARVGHQSCP